MTLRIGVDVHTAAKANRRGVPHYVEQVVTRLIDAHPEDAWRLLHVGLDSELLPESFARAGQLNVVRRDRARQLLSARLSRRPHTRVLGPIDVMFMPALGPTVVDPSVPTVLTLHDMLHSTHRHQFGLRHRTWATLLRPTAQIRSAAAILANSEHTRHELLAELDVPADRVSVVPHGVDDHLFAPCPPDELDEVLARHAIPSGYVLHVGTVEPRKNVTTLVEACRVLRRRRPETALVLAGAIEQTTDAPLHDPANGVYALGMVPAADKRALYRAAGVYCSVSHAEGLGLTPLEALACDTPAVLSSIPAFLESFGPDGTSYVEDRSDPREVADALERLLDDGTVRERILTAGRTVLPRFRWDACAASTYQAFSQAKDPS